MRLFKISDVLLFWITNTKVLGSWLPSTLTKREGWKSVTMVWGHSLKTGWNLPPKARWLCSGQSQPKCQKWGCPLPNRAVLSRCSSPLLANTLPFLTDLEHPPLRYSETILQLRDVPYIFSGIGSDVEPCTGFTPRFLSIPQVMAFPLDTWKKGLLQHNDFYRFRWLVEKGAFIAY